LLARKKTILQRTRCYIFILLYILLYLYKNKHRMCNMVQLFLKLTMSYVFFDWTKYLRIHILAMAFPWSRFAHTKNEEWPPRETLKVSTILSCSRRGEYGMNLSLLGNAVLYQVYKIGQACAILGKQGEPLESSTWHPPNQIWLEHVDAVAGHKRINPWPAVRDWSWCRNADARLSNIN
jgi:hypothetical protein